MADGDGVVKSVSDDRMVVEYKDGREESYVIGNTLGSVEGVDYLHVLKTDLKEGSKFKEGDALYYHKDFYEPDWLDPTKLVFKTNKIVTVALASNSETFEDSSAISARLKDEMRTDIVMERQYILDFDTNIDNLVKPGDEVEPDTPLFVNAGEGSSTGNLSTTTLSLLESISTFSPRAKYKGVIDRIEVKYNGDIEDMSPSLQKLVGKLDRELYKRTKGSTYEAKNNKVGGEYNAGGSKLNIDTLELKVYIRVNLDMDVGNKWVFGNQAKTVGGDVYTHYIKGVETGDHVDAMFAYIGFVHRIIDSPIRMGLLSRLTRHMGNKIAKDYFG